MIKILYNLNYFNNQSKSFSKFNEILNKLTFKNKRFFKKDALYKFKMKPLLKIN